MNTNAIGERIKLCRAKHEMTQAELAERLDIAQASVANYERGRNIPKLEHLIKMSIIFDVDVKYLMNLEGMMNDETV